MLHAQESQEFLPILGDQQKPNMHRSLQLPGEQPCHHLQELGPALSQEESSPGMVQALHHLATKVPSPRFPTISSRREKKQGMRA